MGNCNSLSGIYGNYFGLLKKCFKIAALLILNKDLPRAGNSKPKHKHTLEFSFSWYSSFNWQKGGDLKIFFPVWYPTIYNTVYIIYFSSDFNTRRLEYSFVSWNAKNKSLGSSIFCGFDDFWKLCSFQSPGCHFGWGIF